MQAEIGKALKIVHDKINIAISKRPFELCKVQPRLVAVSKTKPKDAVLAAYNCGQRHFGENYVQELVEKGTDSEIVEKCTDICWHFIGRLQSNKVNKVAAVPNIYMVETINSDKLAQLLNASWGKLNKAEPLKVMVQINTSGEDSKSGLEPQNALPVVDYILKNCPQLQFCGFMTIGAFDYDITKGPNPDFQLLKKCREDVCKTLGLDIYSTELSMGMSADYEHAVSIKI